jgi:glutathione synthase/RimK-type ligase-like ATP-grasp enzyme
LAAFREAGVRVRLTAWDDPGEDPADFDLIVLRSTWNYPEAPQAFLKWLDRTAAATHLLNPPEVVAANVHKRYLLRLAEAGVATVPTVVVGQGEAPRLIESETGWVVKPAIGAGSWLTRRFEDDDLALAFMSELSTVEDALVQPYLPSVESGGERSLVWIDGETTHAVAKRPRFHGQDESVTIAEPPTMGERELADRAIAALSPEPPLYARVDLIHGRDGPLVSEVELIEPSLFFLQWPLALERFVAAVLARLQPA